MQDLTKLIHSHFTNGIPAQELTDNRNEQKRLNDLFLLYDAYCENPCMNVASFLKYKCHHSPKQIIEDLVYFEFIRSTFTRMTRQKAQDLVDWAAQKVLRDAAAVNDRKGMLDAAKVIGKYNQLDKPAPEQEDKSFRPHEIVYTPFIEVADPDRHTIKDKELLQIMHQWDARIDDQEQRIALKVASLHQSAEALQSTEAPIQPEAPALTHAVDGSPVNTPKTTNRITHKKDHPAVDSSPVNTQE